MRNEQLLCLCYNDLADDVMMSRVAGGHHGHVVVGRADKSAAQRRQVGGVSLLCVL